MPHHEGRSGISDGRRGPGAVAAEGEKRGARRVNRGRCGGIAILLIKPAGDVLGGPCASRRLSSLAACCAQHKSDGTDAFQGLKARERRELSDTGHASPDTDHAAAAGRRAPTVSHTPLRRAELVLVAEREREAGSDADELRPKNQTLAAGRVVAAGQKHERAHLPIPRPRAPKSHETTP